MSESVSWINKYAEQHDHAKHIEVLYTPDKGRILVSRRDFDPGETVLCEPPLHLIVIKDHCPAWNSLAWHCEERKVDLEPIWFWAALNSYFTSEEQLEEWGAQFGEGVDVTAVDPEQQKRLLALYIPEVKKASKNTKLIITDMKLTNFVDPVEFEKMLQVWIHNCFEYSDDPLGYVIYFMPSFCSHSCMPNVVWSCEDRTFVLSSRIKIRAGDELCITYISEEALHEPAYRRRDMLQGTKGFKCTCARCCAPADLSRGFRCPACTAGTIFLSPDAGAPDYDPLAPSPQIENPVTQVDQSRCSDPREIQRRLESTPNNVCLRCDHLLSPSELQLMLYEERLFTTYVRSPEAVSEIVSDAEEAEVESLEQKADQLALKDLSFADAQWRLHNMFTHHYIMIKWLHRKRRRWEKEGNYSEVVKCTRAKLELYEKMYPALTGNSAWVRENLADQLLLARAIVTPRQEQSDVADPEIVKDLLDHDHEVVMLYREAFRIVSILFAERNGYLNDVRQKILRLQAFLRKVTGEPHEINFLPADRNGLGV